MTIGVITDRYENTWGKKPRGWGNWAFEIKTGIYWFCGLYSDAKKRALKVARRKDAIVIYLQA